VDQVYLIPDQIAKIGPTPLLIGSEQKSIHYNELECGPLFVIRLIHQGFYEPLKAAVFPESYINNGNHISYRRYD
jgi:hypothetical protein